MSTRRLIILGSTGSIGTQALEVVAHLNALAKSRGAPAPWRVVGLAAGFSAAALRDQASAFGVADVALAGDPGAHAAPGWRVGPDAASSLVREVECDMVLAAMVGAAGLPATLQAVSMGRHVALANKETLVAAGALVVPEARRTGARLLPVDSEHAGLWQCLGRGVAPPFDAGAQVRGVTLTASGGPFRSCDAPAIAAATPAMALRHPTWSMGPKVTIDSASLMNKALEIIEAHWLFGLPGEKIRAVIHPQSLVHAMVEWADGSILAQLGAPDMRGPIQAALAWPEVVPGLAPALDFSASRSLTFEPVDPDKFPALALAYRVIEMGGCAGAILNAANEECVRAFLSPGSGVAFGDIARVTGESLREVPNRPLRSMDDFRSADAEARAYARSCLPGAPAGRGA